MDSSLILNKPKLRTLAFGFLIFLMPLTGFNQDVTQEFYDYYGIYRNPIRVALNNIAWTVSFGYAKTDYNHDINGGFYFYQDTAQQFLIHNNGESLPEFINGYSNWLNAPQLGTEVDIIDDYDVPFTLPIGPPYNVVLNPLLNPDRLLLNTDTTTISYEGFGMGIPVSVSAHYDYLEKFRFGVGWMYERQWVKEFVPLTFGDQIRIYVPDFKVTNFNRFYGMLGYKFLEYWNWNMVGEFQFGRMRYGSVFDQTALNRGFYGNLGVTIENVRSEYLRFVIRPSYDFKQYGINFPGGGTITHKQNAFMITAGVSINIPEIKRSPIDSDHVQLKHVITDPKTGQLVEVRGQPFWKKQNPKVGENHRQLLRYKWKNRRKLNPY